MGVDKNVGGYGLASGNEAEIEVLPKAFGRTKQQN